MIINRKRDTLKQSSSLQCSVMLLPACPGSSAAGEHQRPPEDISDASLTVNFILEPRNSYAPQILLEQKSCTLQPAESWLMLSLFLWQENHPTERWVSREQNSLPWWKLSGCQFCLSHSTTAPPTEAFHQQYRGGRSQREGSVCL